MKRTGHDGKLTGSVFSPTKEVEYFRRNRLKTENLLRRVARGKEPQEQREEKSVRARGLPDTAASRPLTG